DKLNLDVEEILTKIQRLLSEKKFKINGERMKSLARINSKRKYRAADLIEYVIQAHELKEELNGDIINSGSNEIDNTYLYEWISPAKKVGIIRGKYIDVYLALFAIVSISFAVSIFAI